MVAVRPFLKRGLDRLDRPQGPSLGRGIRRKLRPSHRSPPLTRMRLRSMTGWVPRFAAVALALAAGGSARADVCVVINPVLDIGCREGQDAPAGGEPTANSEPAGASREQQPATRSSTVVRYDPRRVAVTFKQGVGRGRARAVISDAGGTIQAAVPQVHAYLLRGPTQRPGADVAFVQTASSGPTPSN